jgi:glycosyltransferase involved in cell wall biosynthesis
VTKIKLAVITHKSCWRAADSPSGFATDGGFPFQMQALSGLFQETTLLLPLARRPATTGLSNLEGRGLRVVPLRPLPAGNARRKLLFPLWLLRHLSLFAHELGRADAVHALVPGDVGTAGLLLAVAAGRPLLVRHCGNWTSRRSATERLTIGLMERFAGGRRVMFATGGSDQPPSARNASIRWIFSSSLTEEQLREQGRVRSRPAANPRLMIACRQEPAKGTGHVIDSLPALARDFSGISFDVVGDGSALNSFREQAARLGVSERVRFHGQVDHASVIKLLQSTDLFVFPTTSSEGFPKAVLEALACGLPVVTTRVSVLPRLLASGAGVLLPEASGAAVTAAVRQALNDPGNYAAMSRQAVETAANYSLERWRDQIGECCRSAWGLTERERECEPVSR